MAWWLICSTMRCKLLLTVDKSQQSKTFHRSKWAINMCFESDKFANDCFIETKYEKYNKVGEDMCNYIFHYRSLRSQRFVFLHKLIICSLWGRFQLIMLSSSLSQKSRGCHVAEESSLLHDWRISSSAFLCFSTPSCGVLLWNGLDEKHKRVPTKCTTYSGKKKENLCVYLYVFSLDLCVFA